MRKNKLYKILIVNVVLAIIILNYSISYADKEYITIKLGVYDYEPYFYIKDGDVGGYYKELLDKIIHDVNNHEGGKKIKIKCIEGEVSSLIRDLEENKIDMMMGLQYTQERKDKFIYSKNYVGVELLSVYTNKNFRHKDIKSLDKKKVAFIKNEYGSEWLLGYLQSKDINPIVIWVDDYKKALQMLDDKSVVATLSPSNPNKLNKYNQIYKFSPGSVYITASKNSRWIIDEIDSILDNYTEKQKNELEKIRLKYFKNKVTKREILLYAISSILILFIAIKYIVPAININKLRKKIKDNLIKDRYTIYYQPIINPKNDKIVGFEALIRYINPEGKIVSPYFFINDIEKSNMTEELAIWVFKNILRDYEWFKLNTNLKDETFYISMNISFNEIKSKKFLKTIDSTIEEDKNFDNKNIIFEIVENIESENLKEIKKGMEFLQSKNIKIASDDFGVKYSNLDILSKLNFDMIKIDKYFIDEIKNNKFNHEIIIFLSKVCKLTNKSIVLEGVEFKEQVDIIKNIDYGNIFIQGYFYGKPEDKGNIELIKNIRN
ncbi:EAL domain-containing protein [Romboutsia sp. 1001713B170131_170501_G6]|uniref:EAL domain-containing protein n=1 Tax=Romboutsia sp. 1001713B170131_170501_G6 TaxID=2787108 RepID=UPI0018AAACBE